MVGVKESTGNEGGSQFIQPAGAAQITNYFSQK